MKRFEKLLLSGTGYTVLILILFYIFAAFAEFENTSIGIGRFFVILGFGMIIGLADLIYGLLTLKTPYKLLIHYALLLTAFFVVFLLGEFITLNGAPSVFIAITIFTVMYFVLFGIVYLIRRTVSIADGKLEKKIAGKGARADKNQSKKPEYTPKFK